MSKKNREGRMEMTESRLKQRCAATIRLRELTKMKGEACLMDAGSDWIDNAIVELEEELRRKENES